ncbi:MAG: hypothetical protein ACOC6E_00145 [Thermodesulfobacteriota bacterium]
MKKHGYLALAAAVLLLLLTECALLERYGKVRILPRGEYQATLQELGRNWQDYHIYYTGLSVGTAAGIIFDPKNDDKSLVGDKWIKVEDQETLSRLISRVKSYLQFYPRLSRILGPDEQFYGYLLYAWGHPVFKVVDKDTLYAYGLKSPAYYGNDGDGGGPGGSK